MKKNKREKKNPCVHLKESDVRRMKNEAKDKAINFAIVIFLSVMRDKFGYGVVRLKRIYDEINKLSQSISEGYVSLYDLQKVLEDEAGIFMEE